MLADLGPYLDALGWHPRAGICLDTCHLFAAGHDLAAPGAAAALLAEFAQLAGRDPESGRAAAAGRLRLIHANDSKDPCGSRRDRHENIGAGQIGTAAFRDLLAHPATAGVPFIVETPGPRAAQAADVAALTCLRGQAGPPAGRPEPAAT
jgi:deoxyribonuclease-4